MREGAVNRIWGYIVLVLSLFAMAMVGSPTIFVMLGQFNLSPDDAEGAGTHLLQIAITLLMPVVVAFLATADWRYPGRVAKRLIAPAVALLLAFSTLYYLMHLR